MFRHKLIFEKQIPIGYLNIIGVQNLLQIRFDKAYKRKKILNIKNFTTNTFNTLTSEL